MKNIKRTLAFLLCAVMILGLLPMVSLAADGEPNFYMTVSAEEVNVGDTFTVTIGHMDMNVASFAFGLDFDKDLLEVTKISVKTLDYYDEENDEDTIATATEKSTKDEANESGHVGVAFARGTETECYGKDEILTVTFKAIAAGTVDFTMFEDSSGTDGYKAEVIEGESVTISEAAAPEVTYTWNKVELSNITATDTIAITMTYTDGTTWALYNANGTSSAPTAVVVTVSGNVMTSEVKNTLAWNIANDNGTLTIYVAGGTDAWLYSTNANNGTRVGNNESKTWVIDSASGYLQHVDTSRYLGVYMTNPDWRSYKNTTGNTANQTLSFWKLVEGDTTVCTHTNATHVTAAGATCLATGNIEHWFCADCGKYFSDAACTTEIAQADTVIAKSEHSFTGADDRICTVCGIYKDGSTLTIDEVLAYGATLASGATTEYKYYVVGTITSVANTTYGNIYITDDGENSLLIYGLYDDGVRYDAMATKPVAGDTVNLYGPIKNYNGTIEIVNAELIEHTVPTCYHNNVTFREAAAATCTTPATLDHYYCDDCKKNYADEACTQMMDTIYVDDVLGEHDYNNPEDGRKCIHCGYYKPDSILTIEEAIAFGNTYSKNTYTADKYYVTGEITEVYNTTYGNMYITDGTNTLTIYGTYSADGSTRYDAMETKPVAGDTITVYGVIGKYNSAQMKNGRITAHTHEHNYVPGTYTWSGDHSTCTVVGTCACGATATATASSTSSVTTVGTCQTAEVVTYTADFAETWAVDQSKDVTGEKDLSNHTSTAVTYTNNGDGTHSATYDCCGGAYVTNEKHTYDSNTHKCACGDVEKFTLTIYTINTTITDMPVSRSVTLEVPYGTNVMDVLGQAIEDGEITAPNTLFRQKTTYFDGYSTTTQYYLDFDVMNELDDRYTMPANDITVSQGNTVHTGWGYYYTGDQLEGVEYILEGQYLEAGWYFIEEDFDDVDGGAWYCFVPGTGDYAENYNFRVEGTARVPYPTVSINGVTYAPNAEDIAYAESKGNEFIDKYEAWFIFGDDGKFQSNVNGKIEGPKATCYAVNGMIPWHYGLAKINNKYYYFVGDAVNGGNKIADGPVWITRTNGIEGLEKGACYYFLGGVQAYNLTDIVDGKYYENGKLMMGAGLVKLEEGYIYVRSNGQVALGEYWVTEAKANGYVEGGKLYNFGEDGILTIDPEKNGIIDGVYYKEGVPYYAGLIEIDGDYYYVRSNGEVATGWYYVTKTNGIDFGTNKLYFGEDGKLQDVKNGIYEGEDGKLYYYVNNRVTGAGLIKIGDDYYYAKTSTGEIVTGTYYITVTNGLEGFTAGQKCVFDENGKLIK